MASAISVAVGGSGHVAGGDLAAEDESPHGRGNDGPDFLLTGQAGPGPLSTGYDVCVQTKGAPAPRTAAGSR
jgi:hypothetical protein